MSVKRDEEMDPQETRTNGQSRPVEGTEDMVCSFCCIVSAGDLHWVMCLNSFVPGSFSGRPSVLGARCSVSIMVICCILLDSCFDWLVERSSAVSF